MNRQPSIFIGSSSENIDYANALQVVLDHDLVTTVWTYGVFLPSGNTLSSLIDCAHRTDFAALFLTPDDASVVRGGYLKTPRDNLVFELGLFIGALGPERVFLLTPRERVDLPSDLQGVTPITYRVDRDDEDLRNALNPAATDIRTAVKRLGNRSRAGVEASREHAPSSDALIAIGKLGAVAESLGASLEAKRLGTSFQLSVIDATRLSTSVDVDLSDDAAAKAIEKLANTLMS